MKNKILPDFAIKWLLLILLYNNFAYVGARLLTRNRIHYNLTLSFDRSIPFLPWTVSIYFGCYIFWAITYALIIRNDKITAKKFALSEITGKTICAIIYIIMPTTMLRPAILGSGFWSSIVRFLYMTDAPDNLFPSIHCFISWLCFLGVKNEERIPKWYKVLSFIFAVLVFISTLTVKQHVILDVISGIFIAELVYNCYVKLLTRKDTSYA